MLTFRILNKCRKITVFCGLNQSTKPGENPDDSPELFVPRFFLYFVEIGKKKRRDHLVCDQSNENI